MDLGILELWFSAAQGFYKESLERPERAAALAQALEKIYGRAVTVSLPKCEPPVMAPAPAAVRPVAPTPSPAPVKRESAKAPEQQSKSAVSEAAAALEMEVAGEEGESDYVDDGALPLPEPVRGGEADDHSGADVVGEDEAGPAARNARRPVVETPVLPEAKKPAAAEARNPRISENKADWIDHPLIQLLLKRVDGELVDVVRENPRPAQEKK